MSAAGNPLAGALIGAVGEQGDVTPAQLHGPRVRAGKPVVPSGWRTPCAQS
jgi:hypothetical protein